MDFNNNKASALNQEQIIPPSTPTPPPIPKTSPRFITEASMQRAATGATLLTVGVAAFDAYQNVKLTKQEFHLKVMGQAIKIGDSFSKGHIDEGTAISKLHVLGLTNQDIVYHLTSTGRYDLTSKAIYAIADKKLVRVKTSYDFKMEHPFLGNKQELEILNKMQGLLHQGEALFTDFKQKLPKNHPFHPVIDTVLSKHKTSITDMKVLQCENLSQDIIDPNLTAGVADYIMDETSFVTEEAISAINLQIEAEKGTQQEQQILLPPHENEKARFPRQKKSGTGRTASITEAFLQKDEIIAVDDGTETTYYKFINHANPLSGVSERTERFNTPKQVMGESIPQGKAISCYKTPPPSAILFVVSLFLWIAYFYLRNTRLEEEKKTRLKQEKSEFQEKESNLAGFNGIIRKFKSKELCLKEAQLLLIQQFDLTESAASEILLKLSS